jgi:hypothetical protein
MRESHEIPLIEVVSWRKNNLRGGLKEAYFYLEQDDWNDYFYYTSYHLHISSLLTNETKPTLIGRVKILKLGQDKNESNLVKTGPLEELDEDFCSMGTSLDYYGRLSLVEESYRNKILYALRDILVAPEIKIEFEREPGYQKSFLRHISEKDDLFTFAPLMISRNFDSLLDLDLNFTFSIPELESPIGFKFDSPTYGWSNDKTLPNRIAVLIGRNGCGKSTLLSRISRVAFSSPNDRTNTNLKLVGEIEPKGLGFPRIILLSYSAFDAFATPGIYKSEKEVIVEEVRNGLGRFVFCGIRDIATELEEVIPKLSTLENGRLKKQDILNDRIENTRLKAIKDLAAEFVKNLNIILELNYDNIFYKTIKLLAAEKSLFDVLDRNILDSSDKENLMFFMNLSTGHKFVLHAITSILAYGAPRSLLLFDEPETHLHPPILAVFMKAIRLILESHNAFMIVATHSPVVLQETLRNNIYVVRREGSSMQVSPPDLETFGENIGVITQSAFGLSAEMTDFHDTLDDLAYEIKEELPNNASSETILNKIESLFDVGLSMQARSYLLSVINKKA